MGKVLKKLAGKEVEWIISPRGKRTCRRTDLKSSIKVWYHFVRTRLMPTMHDHTVSEERMRLLYAIVKGKSINVGRLIREELVLTSERKKGKLFFPALITELCYAAGVGARPREGCPLHRKSAITTMTVARLTRVESHPCASTSHAPSLRPSSTPILEEIQLRQRHIEQAIIGLAQYTRDSSIAIHKALTVISDRIPPLPHFPHDIFSTWDGSSSNRVAREDELMTESEED